MNPILDIQKISKKFNIKSGTREGYLSLRDSLASLFRLSGNSGKEEFWALKDVSFQIYPGDSIGIIGKNGAGKSTLLKILSKITPPTSGKITARGRIASLLEVGTGFHPELTGRENIYLNGSILGLKKREIDNQFDAIVEFSGVQKFLETPLKRYSSGMQLRLAFAVAAHMEPEILVIDEVLAVGDAEFQKKCLGKMSEVSQSGRTIIFVSHDLNVVSSLCNKVCVLKEGRVNYLGNVNEGIYNYRGNEEGDSIFENKTISSKPIYFEKIIVCNNEGLPCSSFFYNKPVYIDFFINIKDSSVKCDLFVMVLDYQKRRLFSMESSQLNSRMRVKIEENFLVRGRYSICAFINQPNIARIDEVYDVCFFEIMDNGSLMLKHGDFDYGSVFSKAEWINEEELILKSK